MTRAKTIAEMNVGDRAFVYPSKILVAIPWGSKWLDPADTVYDAPELGAQIERTETGFAVRVRYNAGHPTTAELEESELKEAGFIPVDDSEFVAYIWRKQ